MSTKQDSTDAAPVTKTCGKCGLSYTGKFCRPCKTKYTAEHRAKNPEQYRLASAKYRANNREKANAASQRWKKSAPERTCAKCGALFTGPAGYCKPCDKLYKAAWHQANKDRPSNQNPDTKRKNNRIAEQRRRARKMAVPDGVSIDIAAKLFAMQKGRCACCKVEFVGTKYELDHIEPLAKGGRHADENLQLLCMRCNRAKADKDPISFMQQLGFLL